MDDVLNIGKRRELFWDDTMIDAKKTGTSFKMHEMTQRECVVVNDEPWGGDCCNYMCVLNDDGKIFRLYNTIARSYIYPGVKEWNHNTVCYAESTDGIRWQKPELGICEFGGSKKNNILFGHTGVGPDNSDFDGFMVIKDRNPKCPPDEVYKAVANQDNRKLWYYAGPDGVHFEKKRALNINGAFDSVNTLLYDASAGKYRCFFRDFHASPQPEDPRWFRDIRATESEDMTDWEQPKPLQYDTYVDWQMYTNNIAQYYRAPHVYVGFPSRYVERKSGWTANYDALCGAEKRRARFKEIDPRTATAVSDTLFMTSRDSYVWKRYGDAFLRPGPEHPANWVYGSVYLSHGMIETKSDHPGCGNELSMYSAENRWTGEPGRIYRYTIRLDGFVSQNAAWYSTQLTTKRFIYDGRELFVNFSTSAYGGMEITLRTDDGKTLSSGEIFGDSTHRRVAFSGGSPSGFAGLPVTMEVKMRDADLYSFIFE